MSLFAVLLEGVLSYNPPVWKGAFLVLWSFLIQPPFVTIWVFISFSYSTDFFFLLLLPASLNMGGTSTGPNPQCFMVCWWNKSRKKFLFFLGGVSWNFVQWGGRILEFFWLRVRAFESRALCFSFSGLSPFPIQFTVLEHSSTSIWYFFFLWHSFSKGLNFSCRLRRWEYLYFRLLSAVPLGF